MLKLVCGGCDVRVGKEEGDNWSLYNRKGKTTYKVKKQKFFRCPYSVCVVVSRRVALWLVPL